MREALEAALLPLATSVDARRFDFQVSLHGLVRSSRPKSKVGPVAGVLLDVDWLV